MKTEGLFTHLMNQSVQINLGLFIYLFLNIWITIKGNVKAGMICYD